jgi:long-subunit fatty acid transport protein
VLEYTDTKLSVGANAGAQLTGILTSGPGQGTMFEYNTNTSNSFAQSLTGELDAAAWALRVGTSFHAPDDMAEVAVDFSIQPAFTFRGEIDGVVHTLPRDSGTILNDYLAGRTTTIETTSTSKDYNIKMKLPSYFRATLAWKPGAVIAFNYTYGFDAMSLRMDSADFNMLYEVQMQHSFRLGLNFEYFQIGGGVILEQERFRMENKTDSSGRSYTADNLIPVASMGWVIPMGTNVKTEWELAALPFPVCKASLTFNY